ncbi:hypothetical protein B0H16DRAFT_1447195 [Mycena metata]|uniref:Uncharacterized protein n=1 Tax=Mycena metata TaxID=1033252 RepID=A0AAD7KCP9_9AGAR|nr:hypothetical protein B0H16DRAFT_1447195 [Mycena metata]
MPKAKKNKGDPPKKRGNRTDAVGLRAEHLFAELDAYCTASAAGTTRSWYPKFFQGYWDLFPWNIPFEEDPTDATRALKPTDASLTEDQKAEKKKIVDETEADERKPRRLLDYQVYMQDECKSNDINAVLAERHPDKVGAKDSIKYRAEIARELLAAESEEVQEDFKVKGNEEYEEAMEEYRKGDGKGASEEDFDEAARAEARTRLVATVKPLLLSIRKLTGYHVTMLVGAVLDGKVEVRSVHGGTVDGQNEEGADGVDFTRWDPTGYKPVVKQFMRYIAAANGTPQAADASAPGASSSASTSATAAGAIPPVVPPAPPLPSSHPPAMPPDPSLPLSPPLPSSQPQPPSAMPPPPPQRAFSPTPPPCSELVHAPAPAAGAPGETQVEGGQGGKGGGEDMEVDERREYEGISIRGPLRRALREMTPGSRGMRIARLERLSDFELTREENMARNKEILASYKITDEVAALMKDVRKDMKRKPGEQGGAASKRPRADGGEEDDYTDDDDSGSEADDGERGSTPTPRARAKRGGGGGRPRAAKAKGKRGRGGGVQTAVGDDNVPKWAGDAHVTLLAGGGGDVWVKVVNLWWDYETKAKFVGPGKGKGTAKRPKEVSGWISRARAGGPVPAIIDVFSFASRWWAWWVEINPAWRARTGNVRTRLAKEGDTGHMLSFTGPGN